MKVRINDIQSRIAAR